MSAASKQGRIKELSRNCISRYMCQSSIYTEGASESALASIVTAPSCTSPPSAPLPLVVDSVPCDSTARRHANISRPPLDPSPLSYLIRLSWPWTPARGRPQRRRRPRRIAGLRLGADEAAPDRRAGRRICGCFAVAGVGVAHVASRPAVPQRLGEVVRRWFLGARRATLITGAGRERGGVGEVDRGAGKAGRDLPPEIDGEVSCEMTSLKCVVGPTWRRLSSVERWASHDLWQSNELWCRACG